MHLFLFFPATLAHELMHYVVALITFGKPKAPYLWPRKTELGWVAGHVDCQRLTAFNVVPIAMAPFVLLPLAYWCYQQSHYSVSTQQVALWIIAAGICFIGAIPSRHDFKLMFRFPISVLLWGAICLVASWLYI